MIIYIAVAIIVMAIVTIPINSLSELYQRRMNTLDKEKELIAAQAALALSQQEYHNPRFRDCDYTVVDMDNVVPMTNVSRVTSVARRRV